MEHCSYYTQNYLLKCVLQIPLAETNFCILQIPVNIYACINSKLRKVLSMDDPLFPYLLQIKPYHLLIFFPYFQRAKYGLVFFIQILQSRHSNLNDLLKSTFNLNSYQSVLFGFEGAAHFSLSLEVRKEKYSIWHFFSLIQR